MKLSQPKLEDSGLVTNKTNAIYDYQFVKALQNVPWKKWFEEPEPVRCREEFLETYSRWIGSSKINKIQGLDGFSQRHLINGTTQSFDEAYFRYADRRMRIFRGEYAYHRRIVKNWAFIDDEPLHQNDFIIMSAPFCSTGDIHPEFYSILNVATALKIPVLIDCAYFGTCEGIELKVDFPCVESVSFSLSKGAGLGDIRSGIRFSNFNDSFPISQQNQYNHTVLAAAKIGLYMMNEFSPDFIPNKYSSSQKAVCENLGITPTKCMHLALASDESAWGAYSVDKKYLRVGIRNLVKAHFKKELPELAPDDQSLPV